MFDEDSQTGKGKYSMDGGTTWQNFSSGGMDAIYFPAGNYEFAYIQATAKYLFIKRNVEIRSGENATTVALGAYAGGGGQTVIDGDILTCQVNSSTFAITPHVDVYDNDVLKVANTAFSISTTEAHLIRIA